MITTQTRTFKQMGLAAAILALPMLTACAYGKPDKHDRHDRHGRHVEKKHHDKHDRHGRHSKHGKHDKHFEKKHYDRQHKRPRIGFDFNIFFGKDRNKHHRGRRSGYVCDSRGGYGHATYKPPRKHRCSGYWKRVWYPPQYHTRYDPCGRPYKVLVREGYYKKVWAPCRDHRYHDRHDY